VIAGEAGGRRLAVPAGRDTRPTSDRAREGLFATIVSMVGSLTGARVLDLYAGSGAVGLEALSRGAEHVLLVESGARASRVIRENIEALDLAGAELVTDRVERVLARGPGPSAGRGRYDIVFADPPYALAGEEVSGILGALADRGWLAPGALVIVERATRSGPVSWPGGFAPDRARRYGEATFWYGRAQEGAGEPMGVPGGPMGVPGGPMGVPGGPRGSGGKGFPPGSGGSPGGVVPPGELLKGVASRAPRRLSGFL
jgi:16S rRNA (guanine966-N2)-methyltransferase